MQSTEKQMEFLKGVISEELYDALAGELAGKDGIKLGNLATGAYVGREKYDALKSDFDALRSQQAQLASQLDQAVARAEALSGAEAQAQAWKQKAEQTAMDAEETLAAARFDFALDTVLREAGARNIRAVRALLDTDALRRAEDFGAAAGEALDAVREENPFLFGGADAPTIVAPASPSASAKADGALRRAMGLEG